MGAHDEQLMRARHNLAHFYGDAGNPERAVASYRELVADKVRVLGPVHPSVLSSQSNLIYWQRKAGDDLDSVVAALRELLRNQNRILGPEDPGTLGTRLSLATCVGDAGNPLAALADFEELLVDARTALGADHPDVACIHAEIAYWREQLGEQ
ncbi:tetratricopeptide repeat protein [Nocardia brasiliensis]